jgi:hypothetical protein
MIGSQRKMSQPTRDELLEVLKALVIDAEETAFSGFSCASDDDARWRKRLGEELPAWLELINRGRSILEASGENVPTPIQIREDRRRQWEDERQRQSDQRNRRLDAKRCKHCGRAKGHNAGCPKKKSKQTC